MGDRRGPRRIFLREGPRPSTIAHRGGAGLRPENTLAAFEGARDLGVRWVELDVHLTRDGALVVHHDVTVDRTTDGTGPIDGYALDALRRLDAGHRHSTDGGRTFPFRGRGLRIPTLEEAFAVEGLGFVIEMKPRDPAVAAAVWRFLSVPGRRERAIVAHAHGPTLRAFRGLARGAVATSAGEDETRRFWLAARAGLSRLLPIPWDVFQVPERAGRRVVVDRRFVAAAHARGLAVQVWTVNDPVDMRRLAELGVDALITDRPDLALGVP